MPFVVHMIGNAHLDPVWLWGWQEGADEVLATFAAAADRCDEYPEFVFTAGEAWRYEQVERLDPELYARIEGHVGAGRWHITGGQYVQPDCNLPTALALRRQLSIGQAYFRDRFGVTATVGFNPDSFGHPATLPDILVDAGLSAYVFHRPSAEQVALPAQTFRWRGAGGAEVTAFRVQPSYVTRSSDLTAQISLALAAADRDLGHTMCFYGVGDHGGGPTKAHIEFIRDHAHAFEGAELRFSTPEAFFAAIAALRDSLPVVTEELQGVFPGCYSVMHDVKQRQRRGEHLLEQSERVLDALVEGGDERARLDVRVELAWKDLLFTSFHDILAGTSVASAWESVRSLQGRALSVGEETVYEATRSWARRWLPPHEHPQLVTFNPDLEAWSGLVETEPWIDFDDWGARRLSDSDGAPVDFQLVDPESEPFMSRVIYPAEIPPRGWQTILVRDDPGEVAAGSSDLTVSPGQIANGRIRVELGSAGIERLVLDGVDLLGLGGLGLHLREDSSDTWTMRADRFAEPIAATASDLAWTVEEEGPLRARVRGAGVVGTCPVSLLVGVERAAAAVRLELEVNMVERRMLLQLPIQLAGTPVVWTDGLAGGAVERAPGPAERPVHGWSRVTLDRADVALVTPDAYSLSLVEDVWQWTLLRTPRMAWPAVGGERRSEPAYADLGVHTFELLLLAESELPSVALHRAARQQLQRPVTFSRYVGVERPPWGDVPPRKLWTPADERTRLGQSPPPDRGAKS